ncbi:MAG: histidine phosphatase family protein [Conexivisphaerales archaeon]
MRHAESTANVAKMLPDDETTPPRLTGKGITQAKKVGSFLADIGMEAIYSSPMKRAVETAAYVSETMRLHVEIDERLRELGLGTLAGKNYLKVSEDDPRWYEEMFKPYTKYGLEKFSHAMERMISFVHSVYSAGHAKVLAVSHLEPIRAVVASGMNDDGMHAREIRLDNASLSIVSYDGSRVRVKCVNWLPIEDYTE